MTDVLLLNPNSRREGYIDEPPLITPPINLMYVAQSLEVNGYKTKILDAFARNLTDTEILRTTKKIQPKVIGIPLYSSDLTKMYLLTEKIKKQNPNIKIFFAGHHASTLYRDVMKQFPKIDFIIRGEGEFTAPELMNSLENEKPIEKINGISFRKKK